MPLALLVLFSTHRMANEEWKFHDVQTILDPTKLGGGILDSVNKIAQGATAQERLGRTAVIRKIDWHCTLSLKENNKPSNPGQGGVFRIILFVDRQANGAGAAIGDVMLTSLYDSFYRLSNSSRFDILYDELHVINYTTMTSEISDTITQSLQVKFFAVHIDCNIPIQFSGTDGLITEIKSNNISILAFSSMATDGKMDGQMRLRWTE